MDETLKQQKTHRPKEPSGFYWQFSHDDTRRSVFALRVKRPRWYEVALLWVCLGACVWVCCNVWQGQDLACQQTPAINFDSGQFCSTQTAVHSTNHPTTRSPWGASSGGSAAASSGASTEASVMSCGQTKNAHSKILRFHVFILISCLVGTMLSHKRCCVCVVV